MKRSAKFHNHATNALYRSILLLSFTGCAAAWAVVAWMASPALGAVVAMLALGLALFVAANALEFLRLRRLSATESAYENERMIRPRL